MRGGMNKIFLTKDYCHESSCSTSSLQYTFLYSTVFLLYHCVHNNWISQFLLPRVTKISWQESGRWHCLRCLQDIALHLCGAAIAFVGLCSWRDSPQTGNSLQSNLQVEDSLDLCCRNSKMIVPLWNYFNKDFIYI